MSIPPRLASKLNEVIGPSAAEDLVNWLDETRARHAELRADLAEVRQEVRASEARLDAKFLTQEAKFNGQLAEQLSSVTATLGGQIAALAQELHVVDNKIERRFSDLILWSFVFWVSAVGAIALLARALRP
jgi:chromosome segregation ATPase